MIALIGTHGTGKTTLLMELAKVRPDLIMVDGDSRPVRRFNKEVNNLLTAKEEQLLINRLSDVRWPIDTQIDNLCCTRTPLDHYAYSHALGWDNYAGERIELFRRTDRSKVKFFYLPIEFKLEDDGIRYSDLGFQITVDNYLKDMAAYFNLTPITLSGTVEQRLAIMLENI